MKLHCNYGPQEGKFPDGTPFETDENDDLDVPSEHSGFADGLLEQVDKWVPAKARKAPADKEG